MSSCAASCCTCSRKASCASATSASWPTANVPPPCHFPSNCSAGHRRQSDTLVTQNSGDLWSCSEDSPLLKSNFVLHRWSGLRHEATLSNSKVFFHALRTSVPSLGTDVLFQLFDQLLTILFRIRPASGLIQSRVALCNSRGTTRRRTFLPSTFGMRCFCDSNRGFPCLIAS
jgi:hypothetical protein